jgi:hypothetical protein
MGASLCENTRLGGFAAVPLLHPVIFLITYRSLKGPRVSLETLEFVKRAS